MSDAKEKARAQRLDRLRAMLEKRLDNPSAALEALLSELTTGEAQTELWEGLHAAAARDGVEREVAAAYAKVVHHRRLAQLEKTAQLDLLLHAADFHQGILGDAEGAAGFLEHAQSIAPGHAESFARLERRFEALSDPRRLVGLYSIALSADPRGAGDLSTKTINKVVPLPASSPLPEEVCERLVRVAATHPILLDVLDAHCRKTKRFDLAARLTELSLTLADPALPQTKAREQRRRVVELYVKEAGAPSKAIAHVEELLAEDPRDEIALAAADYLLKQMETASRAAAALQKARRETRAPAAGSKVPPPEGAQG
jgi:tetratricopeptide (TPR) repeat protein